ncbi:hypothetical protein BC834DRAFT_353829 [Gloeopeniophorella convolvens]|nr:hypothetical protein BC834DRAFT_353829 [Gloeopeniophorella convolvens]
MVVAVSGFEPAWFERPATDSGLDERIYRGVRDGASDESHAFVTDAASRGDGFCGAAGFTTTSPPTPVFTTSADRLEDRGETSSTGSGTYFSSLRNSYNKLRVTDSAPRSPVPGPASTSLPSLKSCGLLDPWVHHSQLQSQQQPQPPQPPPQQPPQQPLDAAGSSEVATSIPASSRGTTSAMPVGLDWLAHER